MSIISFWTEDEKETGQTSIAIATAVQTAIQHNKSVLLITTYERNKEFDAAFWKPQSQTNSILSFLKLNKQAIGITSGMEGLLKLEQTNKLTPDQIKDYTQIIFPGRLEVLSGYMGKETPNLDNFYLQLAKKANMAYDFVYIDLKKGVSELTEKMIEMSDVVVYGVTQRNRSLKVFENSRKDGFTSKMQKLILSVGRYDRFSKYTIKNIGRTTKTKESLFPITYNTLFADSCDEGTVVDFFIKMQTIRDEEDRNFKFLKDVKELIQGILYKIQEMQMMR